MTTEHEHLSSQRMMGGGGYEEPVCVNAPVISGIGEAEVLERIVLDLESLEAAAESAGLLPSGFQGEVAEVVALSKRVTIVECEVFTNKVLVNGTLHKDLLFKFAPDTQPSLSSALLTSADCTLTLADTVDLLVDCPFGACITVPGACPGDRCEVDLACVDAEKELLVDTDGDGHAEQFEEKVCILIRVRTLRNQNLTIQPTANICPGFTPIPNCPTDPCQTLLPSTTRVTRLTR